jgi:microcystin degradation protein MlrC
MPFSGEHDGERGKESPYESFCLILKQQQQDAVGLLDVSVAEGFWDL